MDKNVHQILVPHLGKLALHLHHENTIEREIN